MTSRMPDRAPALNDRQRADVEDARALLAAIDGGRETIIAYVLEVAERAYKTTGLTLSDRRREVTTENLYPEATGNAAAQIRHLLAVIDGLTGGAK